MKTALKAIAVVAYAIGSSIFVIITVLVAYSVGRSDGYTEGYDNGVTEGKDKKDLENSFAEGEALPPEE